MDLFLGEGSNAFPPMHSVLQQTLGATLAYEVGNGKQPGRIIPIALEVSFPQMNYNLTQIYTLHWGWGYHKESH